MKTVTLGEIAKISSGGTPSRSEKSYWGGNIPWVTTSLIQNGIITEDDIEEWITDEGMKNSSAKMVPAGTILMAMYGQGKTRGQVAVLNVDATINQACAAITVNDGINKDFVYQQLLYRYDDIRKLSNNGSQENLNAGLIRYIGFPLCSFTEQTKIANTLTTYDNAIKMMERLITAKERYFEGLSKRLLNCSERYGDIDNEWREIKLGDLGTTYNGLSGKTGDDFGTGSSKYITYKNIFDNISINSSIFERVTVSAEETQNKVKFGDIFFTVSSETPNEVGMSSVLLGNVDDVYLNSFCFGFRLTNFETLLPSFAQFYFRSFAMRDKISRLAQGSTRFNLSKSEMMKIKMLLPSIQEQARIAEILNTAKREIDLLKKLAESYRLQKRGLMQKLLSGEWRVAA